MQYRAIEGTNTRARRLAYLTAILTIVDRRSLTTLHLEEALTRWSVKHSQWLLDYWVHTGGIQATAGSTATKRYLELATNLGLVVPVSAQVRTSRFGLVLYELMKEARGQTSPFHLSAAEKAYYMYMLLRADADLLIAVIDLAQQKPGCTLSEIQDGFQESLRLRLSQKAAAVQQESLMLTLKDREERVGAWRKPERYSEHLVAPRLNWLLDLGLLEEGPFRRHEISFTKRAAGFIAALPSLGSSKMHDVTQEWLETYLWECIGPVAHDRGELAAWSDLSQKDRTSAVRSPLEAAFKVFRRTPIPRVSLAPTLVYVCILLLTKNRIAASPSALVEWLSEPQEIGGRMYEARSSARENESYLIFTLS